MKYIKLLLCLCFAPFVAACSDDESINTGETTVSFANATVSVKENANILNLPIQIEGDQNGLIKVTLSVETATGTTEDESFVMTTKELLIPANTKSVNCEIRLIDDGDKENDDRSMTVKIADVQGAKVGNISDCTVVILDVDKNPYNKLMGNWVFDAIDATSEAGDKVRFDVVISGGSTTEEMDANFEKRFVCTGFQDGATAPDEITWTIEYDAATSSLSVVKGGFYATYNFTGIGAASLAITALDERAEEIPFIEGSWNDKFNQIEFTDAKLIGVGVYPNKGAFDGYFAAYANCTMTKK